MTDLPQPAVFPPQASTPLDGIKPGTQTSEFKLNAIVILVLQLLAGAFLALVGSNAIHVPEWAVPILPTVTTTVSGWLAKSYGDNRTALKASGISQ